MDFSQLNLIDFVVLGSTFILVLAVWLIGLLLWHIKTDAGEQRVQKRLHPELNESERSKVLRLWTRDRELRTLVPGDRKRSTFADRLKDMHRDANFESPLSALILFYIGLCAVVFLFGMIWGESIFIGLISIIGLTLVIRIYLSVRVNKQRELFERQLLDALGLASRSLRAGHPLIAAFQLIVEEMDPPLRPVFLEICQQQALGVGLDEAMRNAAAKSSSEDLKLLTTSTVIQLRSGGNLADMMERLCEVIRERMRLKRKVRILITEAQLSKRVLIALPVFLFLLLWFSERSYIEPLYTTRPGHILLAIGTCLLMLGSWVMNKLSVLRY